VEIEIVLIVEFGEWQIDLVSCTIYHSTAYLFIRRKVVENEGRLPLTLRYNFFKF